VTQRRQERGTIERIDIGRLSREIEEARLKVSGAARRGEDTEEHRQAVAEAEAVERRTEGLLAEFRTRLRALEEENERFALVLTMADGEGERTVALSDIVRAYPPNRMSV
jgi:ABC-type phosphate transport system auxiliary subunit